jgi:hypothetical protein
LEVAADFGEHPFQHGGGEHCLDFMGRDVELIGVNLLEQLEAVGILVALPANLWARLLAVSSEWLSVVLFTSTMSVSLASE